MSDHLPSAEHDPSRNLESPHEFLELVDTVLDMLLGELDPSTVAELHEARIAVLAMLNEVSVDPARREAVWGKYATIGETLAGQVDPSPAGRASQAKVYVTLALHKALIFRDAGPSYTGRYIEELDQTEVDARNNTRFDEAHVSNTRFDLITLAIEAELDTVTNQSELTPEGLLVRLKGEISELHREVLRDQLAQGATLEEILVEAYDALIEEGENPDEVFSRLTLSNENAVVMSGASLIRGDDRIPPGYTLFHREVRLLSGRTEPAFYSTREDQTPDPEAWERSSASIVAGFIWALQVPEFADHETEDDDRTQEIGNMMSYAMSQGLTEMQVLSCYKQAFAVAKRTR